MTGHDHDHPEHQGQEHQEHPGHHGHEHHGHHGHEHHAHGHHSREHHSREGSADPHDGHQCHGNAGAASASGAQSGSGRTPPQRREESPLERGAGVGKVLFFDAFSGISGDMTLAALLDLGVPREVFDDAIAALSLPGVGLAVRAVHAGAIVATRVDVTVTTDQPARPYAVIRSLIENSSLSPADRQLALAMFLRLGEAESKIHGVDLDHVHFHEVGGVDSIIDIVCAATGLGYLGARVVASPLPMGSGFVNTAHGSIPLPAPATLECLRGIPTVPAKIAGELVTPTGATIVAAVATEFASWPSITPLRVGWGAGTKQWPDRPNALRVVLGEPAGEERSPEQYEVLETNVDDMTGELAAFALSALRGAGAVDSWATPLTMKKGRPGFMLSAVVPRDAADSVLRVMLAETTSIGVRRSVVCRCERPRRVVVAPTRFGEIPVKVSEGDWGPPQVKPEFDVAATCAQLHGVPVRVVLDDARRVALGLLEAEALSKPR